MYTSLAKMIAAFSAEELAQLADRGIPRLVTAEMLVAAAADAEQPDLTEEEQAALELALAAIDRAIVAAGAEIDPYLVGRYPLPLASIPAVLSAKAADLARYQLYADRATEHVEKRRGNAISFLKDLAARRANLGLDEAQQPVKENASVQFAAEGITAMADKLRNY